MPQKLQNVDGLDNSVT